MSRPVRASSVRGARVLALLTVPAVLGVLGVLVGCGSGALEGPDVDPGPAAPPSSASTVPSASPTPSAAPGDDPTGTAEPGGGSTGGNGGTGGGGGLPDPVYGWGLPEGPYTPDSTWEDDVYVPLARGDCARAQEALDTLWEGLKSPRGVLLYQAAIDLCRDDRAQAERRWAQANAFGWAGLHWPEAVDPASGERFHFDCEVHRSLRAVLEQQPRESFPCAGTDVPPWGAPEGFPQDDPRTPADESAPTPDPATSEPPAPEPLPPDPSPSAGTGPSDPPGGTVPDPQPSTDAAQGSADVRP